ncbi:MAG: AI-2E family transporter [Chloroflexi bacterium]|nr:AI-2E family transporter [Chloroflexota bacterium]
MLYFTAMDNLPESRDIRITPMSFVLGAGVVLIVVFIAIIATRIVSVLVLLFLGILLAESIRPIANKLRTWKIPRGAAVMIVYFLLALVLTGLGLILVPPLVVQVREVDDITLELADWARDEVPRLYQISVDFGFDDEVRELGSDLTSTITQLIGTLAVVPFQVLGFLFGVVSVLVIGFFWMSATERLNRSVIALLPPKRATAVRNLAAELSQRAGGWVRGQVILMVFIGTVTFVGLFVLGVPYPLALATWASLMEIIPIIGPFLGAIPAVLVALIISPWLALATAILYVIIQQLENNILVPKVMERAVGLHPILVMVGVLAGGVLYGILGIVIAVPLVAAMQVLVMRLALPWLIAQMATEDDPKTHATGDGLPRSQGSAVDESAPAHEAPETPASDPKTSRT